MKKIVVRKLLELFINHPIHFAILASILLPGSITLLLLYLDVSVITLFIPAFVFVSIWIITLAPIKYRLGIITKLAREGKFKEGHVEEIDDPFFSLFGNPVFKVIRTKKILDVRLVWLN